LLTGRGELAANRGIRQVPAVPRQQEVHPMHRGHGKWATEWPESTEQPRVERKSRMVT
jgi:hypothetical protein